MRRGGAIVLLAEHGFRPASPMYLPSLPSFQAELGTSASRVQPTLAAFMAGLGIGQFIVWPERFAWLFATNALDYICVGQLNRRLLARRSPERIAVSATLFMVLMGAALVPAAA